MPTDRGLFVLAVLLYGVSTLYSVFLWQRGFRQDNRALWLLLFAAGCLHTGAMVCRGFSFSRCPVTNLYEATAFAAWGVVASYLGLGLVRRLRFLGAFASPLLLAMGVFALMPHLDTHGPQAQYIRGFSSLHASLVMLAYGSFGIGALAGAMYLNQEWALKFDKKRAVFALMPPIQRLEVVADRALVIGMALLSCGLAVGIVWLHREHGVFFKADAKILWSVFIWLMYGVLLVLRRRHAAVGHRFAWGAIGGFCFLLCTFWGFNLLSEIHSP